MNIITLSIGPADYDMRYRASAVLLEFGLAIGKLKMTYRPTWYVQLQWPTLRWNRARRRPVMFVHYRTWELGRRAPRPASP